ncbi:MAG: hypothetical protein ACTTKL_04595 [Treponema sp.]
MKKIFLAAAALALFAGIAFSDEGMKVSVGNCSIGVPVGWTAQKPGAGSEFILFSPLEENDTFQENCNFVKETLLSKYTAKNYLKAAREMQAAVFTDFAVLEDGGDYQIVSAKLGGQTVMQIQFAYVKGMTAYTLTFSSTPEDFDRYIDTFRQIEKTFQY